MKFPPISYELGSSPDPGFVMRALQSGCDFFIVPPDCSQLGFLRNASAVLATRLRAPEPGWDYAVVPARDFTGIAPVASRCIVECGTVAEAELFVRLSGVSLLAEFHPLRLELEREVLHVAGALGVPVLARIPAYEKLLRAGPPPVRSHREEVVGRLRQAFGMAMQELFVRFALAAPGVASVVLDEDAAAGAWAALNDEDYRKVRRLSLGLEPSAPLEGGPEGGGRFVSESPA